jgi:hypothetical protein
MALGVPDFPVGSVLRSHEVAIGRVGVKTVFHARKIKVRKGRCQRILLLLLFLFAAALLLGALAACPRVIFVHLGALANNEFLERLHVIFPAKCVSVDGAVLNYIRFRFPPSSKNGYGMLRPLKEFEQLERIYV